MRLKEIDTGLNEGWIQDIMAHVRPERIASYLEEIKQRLKQEGAAAEHMARSYHLWTQNQASPSQIREANDEMVRIVKILGLGAVFALPGGGLILPLLVKLAKKFNIELLPTPLKSQA